MLVVFAYFSDVVTSCGHVLHQLTAELSDHERSVLSVALLLYQLAVSKRRQLRPTTWKVAVDVPQCGVINITNCTK